MLWGKEREWEAEAVARTGGISRNQIKTKGSKWESAIKKEGHD